MARRLGWVRTLWEGTMRQEGCGACFENGPVELVNGKPRYHGKPCRVYASQRIWNKKMRTLLSREPEEAPIPPAPDYSNMGELERWVVSQSVTPTPASHPSHDMVIPNTWWRETSRLLASDGKAYKDFMRACAKGVPNV